MTRAENEFDREAAQRLATFSDAVVAIAITLLALDLPVPKGVTNHEFLHSTSQDVAEYAAFLISFAAISLSWFGHHRVFRYLTRTDGLRILNMVWLLAIVLTPFAARVITGDGAFQSRFIFYASVQILGGLAFVAMLGRMERGGMIRDGAPPDLVTTSYLRLIPVTAMFALSIPIALFTPWAYLCWIAIPIAARLIAPLIRRWRNDTDVDRARRFQA